MLHFISSVKPTPQEQVLLILDGHSSHTQSLAAIEIALRHGVVAAIPQHASNAASRHHVFQATEYVHVISDCNDAEGATTLIFQKN
jgi:hypothetical protein